MKYRRSHAVEMGRRLVKQDQMKALRHRDTGGGLRWNAIGQFAPNPVFGMQPANVMQIPPMSGPGGYTSAPNQNTSPAAIMMASQAHASGGQVDENALAHAHRLLYEAKRACGGQVSFKSGGEVLSTEPLRGPPQTVRSAKEIVELWDRIERENRNISADRQFSYLCAKSPEVRRIFKAMLRDSYSRSGARATIGGGMRALAAEEE